MSIRDKLQGTFRRHRDLGGGEAPVVTGGKSGTGGTSESGTTPGTEVRTETSRTEPGSPVDVPKDNPGALAALRSLALQQKTPEKKKGNQGSKSATLGAKLMDFARGETGKKAFAAMSLGMSLFGTVQNAAAEVVHVGSGTEVQQAAQQIAKDTGQPFVQVDANKAALEKVLQRAEAGEISLKHLVLDWGEGTAMPQSWEWQQLQQQYPKAFDQVEQVHIIGSNLQNHPFQGYSSSLFKNAKALVAFDLSTAMEPGPASAWVLEQTTQGVASLPAGMSPQDALIQAKKLAAQGASGGVATRVDIGDQSHTQAVESPLGAWLDEQGQSGKPVSMGALEAKLKELAATPEGLSDSVLGSLAARLSQPGFAIDYDAARLGQHLIDVRRAAGSETAAKALQDGRIHEVRQELAAQQNPALYAQERSPLFSTEITRGVPLTGTSAIPTGGLQGQAFLVDGLGTIRNGEVNVQAIRHPKNGDGIQLTFKLGHGAGAALEKLLNAHNATLVDKTIVNQAPKDGRVVTAEHGDQVSASATVDNQQPEMSVGPALRLEENNKFRLDYFPESMAKQSMRGEVQLQVYGASDATRNVQLRQVLEELGLKDVIGGKPSEVTEQKLIAFRLLEQADPRAHHALMSKLEQGGAVSLQDLQQALIAAEVPPAFLQQAYFANAAPGHLSVVVPGQSDAYARRGVHALYHTMGNAETFAFIASDGALMSTKDRLQVGKVFRGMSSDEDLRSGGAEFVFTRQVTTGVGNPSAYEMRGGAIIFKPDVLDRADWFAYSGDRYGTTLAGDRGKPSEAVRQIAQRAYQALKDQGDASVQGQDFDTWFNARIQSQVDHRENIYLPRPVGRHQVRETTGSSNETMLEGTIPLSQMERFIVPNQEAKDKVLAKLKSFGINEINGVKVEDFVQGRDKSFFTEEEMLRLQQPVDAKPGERVTDPKRDPRLQFYVRNQAPVTLPGLPGGNPTATG